MRYGQAKKRGRDKNGTYRKRSNERDRFWSDWLREIIYICEAGHRTVKKASLHYIKWDKNFLSHRYFMLYRIENDTVYVDNIFHELQDYENKMN